MKVLKLGFLGAIFLILGLLISPISAAENQVNIYFFWSKSCSHCANEKPFLEKISEDERIELKSIEITSSRKNQRLLQEVSQKLQIDVGGVPLTVIGDKHFIGYRDDATTGKAIEEVVEKVLTTGDLDIVGQIIESTEQIQQEKQPKATIGGNEAGGLGLPETLNLPILGTVKIANLSLPILTLFLGLLDGFNPCAMWTLFFLISLLLGMKDRKRMWILGATFIVTSALIYFLFMVAWLNLFLFLGFLIWVRLVVGMFALGAGGYHLRDYWVNRQGACKITDNEKRQQRFDKLRSITQKQQLLMAVMGMILLAVMVNMVELVCSAGLPAVYTKILSMSNLSRWQYYAYMLFYILIFMIDDLFVFFVAMITFKTVGIDSRYARTSRLIGGIVMLVIGILMLFKPEWLMFA